MSEIRYTYARIYRPIRRRYYIRGTIISAHTKISAHRCSSIIVRLLLYGSIRSLTEDSVFLTTKTSPLLSKTLDFDISESLSAGAGCGYTQSTPDWRQYSSHTYYYSFYVKKTFCDKKLDVTLQINNPFNKYSRLKTDEWGDYFRQTHTNDITARSLGLRLSYQFGSGKRSEVKRNRNLKTDDLDISTGVD